MSSIKAFIKNYFDEEEFLFDFNKIDNTYTRSAFGDIKDEHTCHTLDHIGTVNREEWCRDKIRKAFEYAKGGKNEHGSFTPTYFETEEDASALLEFFLNGHSAEKKQLEDWIKNKDIFYNDRKLNQLTIVVEFRERTGLAMVANTDYRKRFECHAVKFVFEYTASLQDGDFCLYDMYPVFTKKDKDIIMAAKAQYKANKSK